MRTDTSDTIRNYDEKKKVDTQFLKNWNKYVCVRIGTISTTSAFLPCLYAQREDSEERKTTHITRTAEVPNTSIMIDRSIALVLWVDCIFLP